MRTHYEVILEKQATDSLAKLPKRVQQQIVIKLESLATNPRGQQSKKLTGKDSLFRIRCGDYCIVYTIREKKLLVLVVRIEHRSKIYRNL